MATQKSWNKAAGYEMFKAGKTDKEIGEALGVTAATVSYYRKKYWDKCVGSKSVELAPAEQEEETVRPELVGMEANIPEVSEPDEAGQETAEDVDNAAQDAPELDRSCTEMWRACHRSAGPDRCPGADRGGSHGYGCGINCAGGADDG